MSTRAEYIWIDGVEPTNQLRSKTRFYPPLGNSPKLDDFVAWSFDGSSTNQSKGVDSDLILQPVRFFPDPIREGDDYLVLCEVLNGDETPHATNGRAKLRETLARGAATLNAWFGFEQEYTLFAKNRPLGWPEVGFPAPQGPFYCGVGFNRVYGRGLAEQHALACVRAGVMIFGVNAEVMPAQWEFQIGPRGFDGERADAITVSDHLWLARWLLLRVGENLQIEPSFDVKPIKGDWNGAGLHTNFSTQEMRRAGGLEKIHEVIRLLGHTHNQQIIEYGHGLSERLTGLHETAHFDEFTSGVANRSASIRIPRAVAEAGRGYLEDRRPGANADPYSVCRVLLESMAGLS